MAIVLYVVVHDEMAALECKKGGVPFMQQLFKEWLVANWTRSKRPNDDTAIPDGTRASDIDTLGYTSIYMPEGMLFYTDAGGGVAYEVSFDRYCGWRIMDGQRCPHLSCSLIHRLTP